MTVEEWIRMDSLSYEEALKRLEATVVALQDGQIPLDQALRYYQEGMELAQYCNSLLQKAELSVQQLRTEGDGTLSLEPLNL
jgi:exodeoxyribonuclease VII small subunit